MVNCWFGLLIWISIVPPQAIDPFIVGSQDSEAPGPQTTDEPLSEISDQETLLWSTPYIQPSQAIPPGGQFSSVPTGGRFNRMMLALF